MKPTYTRAEVYTINAKCETPLRTGGNGDSLEIVLYREGKDDKKKIVLPKK